MLIIYPIGGLSFLVAKCNPITLYMAAIASTCIIFPIGDLFFPVAKRTPIIWPMDYTFVADCNYADHLHNWLTLNCTVLRDWQSVFCCHHSLFVCVRVCACTHACVSLGENVCTCVRSYHLCLGQ